VSKRIRYTLLTLPSSAAGRRASPLAVGCLVVCCLFPSAAAAQVGQAPVSGTPVAPRLPVASIFDDLFVGTVTDVTKVSLRDTVTLVGVGAAAAAFGHSVDGSLSNAMAASSGLDKTLGAGETIGGARLQLAAALSTYAVGRFSGQPTVTRIGAELVRAQLMVQAMTAGIKMAVRRERPDNTQFSFPSGHSSVSFASATVLQRNFGWRAGVPAYAVATYVAASRIQDKRHFLSDVTFGAALGILAGRTVTVGTSRTKFEVVPHATVGGGAVSLRWLPTH
jgi:hypothetical protein